MAELYYTTVKITAANKEELLEISHSMTHDVEHWYLDSVNEDLTEYKFSSDYGRVQGDIVKVSESYTNSVITMDTVGPAGYDDDVHRTILMGGRVLMHSVYESLDVVLVGTRIENQPKMIAKRINKDIKASEQIHRDEAKANAEAYEADRKAMTPEERDEADRLPF